MPLKWKLQHFLGNQTVQQIQINVISSSKLSWNFERVERLKTYPAIPELGRAFCFPLDSRTRMDPSFSRLRKSFSLHLFAFKFSKSFQKTQKNIERLKFLGRKPGPEGGQILLYTASSTLLCQPSPVERRVVGGPSIREHRCRHRSS